MLRQPRSFSKRTSGPSAGEIQRSPPPRDGPDMVIGNLIEVGVAVTDLDAAGRTFANLLGARMTNPIRAPMFSMDFRMGRLEAVDFELMMPYAESSVVRRFIARRG